jgi:hypothetical protein
VLCEAIGGREAEMAEDCRLTRCPAGSPC